ncbi:MAG: nucleotidyltransferase [Eubacteriales bacterium]|nr:nucleotidyltransferase [Eubacteriales bacterium]
MDKTLVILAAGIGSRYGVGIKQLEGFGPNNELIIDYSIHDAIKAGFNKVVYILRDEIFEDFKEVIGSRNEKVFRRLGLKWEYVMQTPGEMPEGRKKPWGTGQAVLCCKDVLHEPFCVINADDYYGPEAFVEASRYLETMKEADRYGLVGYILRNTLSDNGGVTRGICTVENGVLVGIDETKNIEKTPEGARSGEKVIDVESTVSMNFWMYPAEFVDVLEKGFPVFREKMTDPLKDEYLLPIIVDELLKEKKCKVDVLTSDDHWFGVTYAEDKETVQEEFRRLYREGRYDEELYSDIIE